MGLSSYQNVYNSCLGILRQRGFSLKVEREPAPDGRYPPVTHWVAKKDGFRFEADNPIELLGLVAIYDHIKPDADTPGWWRWDGPDLWTEIMEEASHDGDRPASTT